MEWTASETDLAVRYWREGFSATQIAKLLPNKRSRNAIIGKIHRKLGPRHTPNTANRDRKRARAASSDSKITDAARFEQCCCGYLPEGTYCAAHRALYMPRPEKKRPEPVASLNIPFLETGFGQCRAITDATRFEQRCCGHLAEGTYCAAHRAVYMPRTERAR